MSFLKIKFLKSFFTLTHVSIDKEFTNKIMSKFTKLFNETSEIKTKLREIDAQSIHFRTLSDRLRVLQKPIYFYEKILKIKTVTFNNFYLTHNCLLVFRILLLFVFTLIICIQK